MPKIGRKRKSDFLKSVLRKGREEKEEEEKPEEVSKQVRWGQMRVIALIEFIQVTRNLKHTCIFIADYIEQGCRQKAKE